MKYLVYILILLACLLSEFSYGRYLDSHHWDFLVFAQQWPSSVCVDAKQTHSHTCKIANNVTTWTIHGVWPTKSGGSLSPAYCNNSSKFDRSALHSIEGQMMKYWPNLYTNEPLVQLWEHEWKKHGTCAESLPAMDSQLNYFSTGLKLNRQYDLQQLFKKAGITPSNNDTYSFSRFVNALDKGLEGSKSYLQCYKDEEAKVQYISQIEICLDRSFKPRDCEKHSLNLLHAAKWKKQRSLDVMVTESEPCDDTVDLIYPVMH